MLLWRDSGEQRGILSLCLYVDDFLARIALLCCSLDELLALELGGFASCSRCCCSCWRNDRAILLQSEFYTSLVIK
jgi:hypothetical protein